MSVEKVGLIAVAENAVQRVAFKEGGKIKAKVGTKYLFKLDDSDVAPENVTVKRDGKDLQVFFEGSDKPDLTIEDFFVDGMDSQLYGVSENGQMYAYVRTDGEGFYGQLMLADGEEAPVALGAIRSVRCQWSMARSMRVAVSCCGRCWRVLVYWGRVARHTPPTRTTTSIIPRPRSLPRPALA